LSEAKLKTEKYSLRYSKYLKLQKLIMDYGGAQNKIQLPNIFFDNDDYQLEFYQLFVIIVYS